MASTTKRTKTRVITPEQQAANDEAVLRAQQETKQAQIEKVQAIGGALLALIHEIGGTDPNQDSLGSRHLALAFTHAEDAINRAIRHIAS